MKKPKSLEVKLRSAIRLIWSRSAERRAILKAAIYKVHIDNTHPSEVVFDCPICKKCWPSQMAEVDHIEPIGSLVSWRDVVTFIDKMFFGPQRAVCKLCHRKKSTEDMRKMRAKRKLS